MSRFAGLVTVVGVVLLAMAFAAGNAGQEVTLNLLLFTLYRVPVTLVAFGGLFAGMVVMFATGIHSDLKVRRVLRERLAEESRQEQTWIDRNQQDLFADYRAEEPRPGSEEWMGPAAVERTAAGGQTDAGGRMPPPDEEPTLVEEEPLAPVGEEQQPLEEASEQAPEDVAEDLADDEINSWAEGAVDHLAEEVGEDVAENPAEEAVEGSADVKFPKPYDAWESEGEEAEGESEKTGD